MTATGSILEIRRAYGHASAKACLRFFVVALAGCGEADAPSSVTPRESTPPVETNIIEDTLPSGVVVVTNRGSGDWTPDEVQRVEERAWIGALDARGTAPFGRVMAVTLDEAKRIYVADAHAHQVHVFDSSGVHIRSLGRAGEGPGEFAIPTGFAWRTPSELWILDYRQGRMAVFDTAGRHLRLVRRPPIGVGIPKWGGLFDADRLVERGGGNAGNFLVAMDPAELEEKARLPDALEGIPPDPHYVLRSPTGVMFQAVPYAPRHLWALDGRGGLWVGWSGEYKIIHRTLAGDTTLVVLRPTAEGAAVSPGERAQAIESMRWTDGIDLSQIPASKPYFFDLVAADNGELWVVREGEGKSWLADVFAPNGHFRGTVELPYGPMPDQRVFVSGDDVVMVTAGPMDVPIVVRLARTRGGA